MPGLDGRRRKPSHLRIVDGNRGKRAAPKKEPKPTRGIPATPSHVKADELAHAEWARLVTITNAPRTGVLTLADGPMLEATVLAYSTFRQAFAALTKGLTYKCATKSGGVMYRQRPEVFIAADAWRRYITGLTHFWLSPAARGKVATIADDEEKDPAAEFLD
ncbi:MAG: P27 family phage terminase small subunit [Thermoanaerobaculia bacterium]